MVGVIKERFDILGNILVRSLAETQQHDITLVLVQ